MTIADKGYLNTLCGNRPHQGFVLRAHPLDFEPISFLPGAITETEGVAEMQAGDSPPELPPTVPGQVWLALDEVTDPQNFGALLRSAHFFGVGGVVTCAKNSSGLTATVSKASAGALEVMRVHSAANMMRFLRRSRENGWRIVGTSVSERSMALQDLNSGPSAPPTVVVLGNEGRGVRTNVLRECDVVVEVAGGGQGATLDTAAASTVDSLNVSVTGGVMLYHLLAGAKRASVSAADVGSEPPAAAAPAM